MKSGKDPAAPQIPQQGTAEGKRGEVIPQRHHDGADGARPKHDALARRKYGLLASQEPAVDPAAAEHQGSRYIPKDTSKTGRTDGR